MHMGPDYIEDMYNSMLFLRCSSIGTSMFIDAAFWMAIVIDRDQGVPFPVPMFNLILGLIDEYY